MTTATFDTPKASRKFKADGFADTQADALIDTIGDIFADWSSSRRDSADDRFL